MINATKQGVGIVGCGWLGTALATSLQQDNIDVFATTTSVEKQNKLSALTIKNELLTLPASFEQLANKQVFKQAQLVICITPQLKYGKKDYAQKIANIVDAANQHQVQHLILISSSAVYGGLTGKIAEDAQLDLHAEKVAALVAAEQTLSQFSGSKTILRLTGLVGEDRHPGRFLAGKTALSNANIAVNMIHQTDAVAMIRCLLNNPSDVQQLAIYNGCSNTHVSRKEFYRKAARAINATPPEFVLDDNSNKGKIIITNKIQEKHNYQLVYPDLLAWLDEKVKQE